MPSRTTALRTVRRAMEDEELQEHLRNAFVAARKLNSQLATQRDVPRIAGLATDKKAQSELRVLVEELGATANRIAAAPRPRRRRLRRALLLIGAAIAAYMIIRRFMRGDTLRTDTAPGSAPPAAPA